MGTAMLKTWAIVATAVALVLFGIVIGRHTDSAPTVQNSEPVRYSTQETQTQTEPGQQANTVKKYSVPVQFNDLKSEWRSEPQGPDDLEGYSALFDPERREVIVEQCRHAGYFDKKTGQPVDEVSQDFCAIIIRGSLTELTERSATVLTKSQDTIEVSLELDQSTEQPRLLMAFDQHSVELIPGSRNDLYQQIDRLPVIKEQKSLLFAYGEEQLKKRLQAQQALKLETPPEPDTTRSGGTE